MNDPIVDPGVPPGRGGRRGRAARRESGALACVNCHTPLDQRSRSPFCEPCRTTARQDARVRAANRSDPTHTVPLADLRVGLLDETDHASGEGWVAARGGVFIEAGLARDIRAEIGRLSRALIDLETVTNNQRSNRQNVIDASGRVRVALAALNMRIAGPFDPQIRRRHSRTTAQHNAD